MNQPFCALLRRVLALAGAAAGAAFGASDAVVTYQGYLTSDGRPVTGHYDLKFTLFNAAAGGEPVAPSQELSAVGLTNGLVTVGVDFGSAVFGAGAAWLEVAVRTNAAVEAHQLLQPRQLVSLAPRAGFALRSGTAATAQTLPPAAVTSELLAPAAVTAEKVADGHVVRSLNGLRDHLVLTAGPGLLLSTQALGLTLSSSAWGLAGNAGTSVASHFIGTVDDEPVEIRANNHRALRLETLRDGAVVNVLAGHGGNTVDPGIEGATIAGGGARYGADSEWNHRIAALYATIGGGMAHRIESNASISTIAGGMSNSVGVYANDGTISGGRHNSIGDDAFASTIGGGWQHRIAEGAYHSVVSGGWSNTVAGHSTTVGGGVEHRVLDGARFSTIGGGAGHVVGEGAYTATIAGGGENRIGPGSFRVSIGGGKLNRVGTNSPHVTISGGLTNEVLNDAEGAVIPGGIGNRVAGAHAFAAGRRAVAEHAGSFVWADGTDADFATLQTNEFAVRASGGVRFVTAAGGVTNVGAALAPGSGSWSTLSDRAVKRDFRPVDAAVVLEGVASLPVQTWGYVSQPEAVRHIGPTAQDFQRRFGVGEDERMIAGVDADGVAFAAIQGLHRLVREQERQLAELRAQVAELRAGHHGSPAGGAGEGR